MKLPHREKCYGGWYNRDHAQKKPACQIDIGAECGGCYKKPANEGCCAYSDSFHCFPIIPSSIRSYRCNVSVSFSDVAPKLMNTHSLRLSRSRSSIMLRKAFSCRSWSLSRVCRLCGFIYVPFVGASHHRTTH